MNIDAVSPEFGSWLASYFGETRWIVARKSAKRIKDGYEVFLTQRRYFALLRYFEKEKCGVETDLISNHLTEPDMAFARQRKDTFPGMAHWAGSGPEGATCRGCERWSFDGYLAGSGLLKDAPCSKYKALMHGASGGRVPHFAKACKYFEPATAPRPIEKK